jgi:RNA polymerase sigma-70 factor (ECF subfamily)
MQLDAERNIIERAKTDPQAFGLIFDKYYPKILAYTVRRTNDVAVAEEIVSEAFIKALQGLHKFRWRGISIEAWLFRITVNQIRMHFRRNPAVSSLDELYEQGGYEPASDYDLAKEALEAQEKLSRHQQFIRAQEIMNSLPIKYQDVLMLRFAEEKKINEIAVIVKMKEGTVKSLISRGLARLRQELAKNSMQPKNQKRIIKDESNN